MPFDFCIFLFVRHMLSGLKTTVDCLLLYSQVLDKVDFLESQLRSMEHCKLFLRFDGKELF